MNVACSDVLQLVSFLHAFAMMEIIFVSGDEKDIVSSSMKPRRWYNFTSSYPALVDESVRVVIFC